MNLREIHVTDAEAYLDLLSSIESESPYALLEPGERRTTIREQMAEIEAILARDNQTILVVEDGADLVGWLGAFGETYRRVEHNVLLGVGVHENYRRRGIGTWLFTEIEKWAWDQNIRRMELLVLTQNKPAISLYRKMGFQIEGTKRESYLLNGEYLDEYLMSKLLVRPEPPRRNPFPKW
ncbi:MAG: GNAT family N-acetyltransferase [Bacteroidia bacterium]|nr:GNAT family N-acetyltransferase [Bacteroidia bacterium]